MKAVIYARYSSDSQREESIEGQLRECGEFAEKNGITVLRSYIDRAFSAILTRSTKERLEALEAAREDLEIKIANEKISKPKITPEFVTFWLHRFRKLDVENEAHRKMLVDTFVNAVYLYDDKIVVTFNYKDNSSSISLAAVTEAAGNGSDMVCSGAPTSGRKFRGFSFAFHRFGRILHLKGLYSQRAFSPLLQFLPQTGFFVLSGVDLFSMKLFKKL